MNSNKHLFIFQTSNYSTQIQYEFIKNQIKTFSRYSIVVFIIF